MGTYIFFRTKHCAYVLNVGEYLLETHKPAIAGERFSLLSLYDKYLAVPVERTYGLYWYYLQEINSAELQKHIIQLL